MILNIIAAIAIFLCVLAIIITAVNALYSPFNEETYGDIVAKYALEQRKKLFNKIFEESE
jgi:Na+/melibiose symporter-like transporter